MKMMCQTLFFMVFGILLLNNAFGSPINEVPCEILPFQEKIISHSFLKENHFMCPVEGSSLHTAQFCEHLYKCPFDFQESSRHAAAICKKDGTWDYEYPTCEDNMALAEEVDLELIIEGIDEKSTKTRRKEQQTLGGHNADAILKQLDRENKASDLDILEKLIGARRKRSWTLVKPQPTDTVTREKVKKSCMDAKMCTVVDSSRGCEAIESLKDVNIELMMKFCHICIKIGICSDLNSMKLLA